MYCVMVYQTLFAVIAIPIYSIYQIISTCSVTAVYLQLHHPNYRQIRPILNPQSHFYLNGNGCYMNCPLCESPRLAEPPKLWITGLRA